MSQCECNTDVSLYVYKLQFQYRPTDKLYCVVTMRATWWQFNESKLHTLPDSPISLAYILYQTSRRPQKSLVKCTIHQSPLFCKQHPLWVYCHIFSTWTFPLVSGMFTSVLGFFHGFQAIYWVSLTFSSMFTCFLCILHIYQV